MESQALDWRGISLMGLGLDPSTFPRSATMTSTQGVLLEQSLDSSRSFPWGSLLVGFSRAPLGLAQGISAGELLISESLCEIPSSCSPAWEPRVRSARHVAFRADPVQRSRRPKN